MNQLASAFDLIGALSYALDLTEGQPMGHSLRSCLLGMRIAREIGLDLQSQSDTYYALLLKDAGCSSNSSRLFQILVADEIRAKRDVKLTDWTRTGWESLQYALTHVAVGRPFLERVATLCRVAAKQQQESCELVKIRCERGASIARRIGFNEQIAAAIHSLDEHYNGGGYPDGLRGNQIPMGARIALLSQTLEVFWRERGEASALEVIAKRSRRWFDPALVRAAQSLAARGELFVGLDAPDLLAQVERMEPLPLKMQLDDHQVERICLAFAEIIDAKTPFTFRHSNGVAAAATRIATTLGMTPDEVTLMRRSALLHDIGKLSVPNSILEKPAKLDADEWEVVKKHPHYSHQILSRIPGFANLAEIAANHHERLDGRGYYRNFSAEQLSVYDRIIAVADVYDALAAERPYREALPPETVFGIMSKDAPRALDPEVLEALMFSTQQLNNLNEHLLEPTKVEEKAPA
jgi:putative nucleotidyltransferase with HDIG domain